MIPSSLYCSACGAANATDRSVCFACKQLLKVVSSENNTPLLQGRYRILTQVGKGGFGAVYRAEDTQEHDRIVAIKQINLRGLTSQETIEATDAFNREVSLLSHLSHPNLPHIYDNFTDPEHWYLVMDFIEGETLETYLEAKGANDTASLSEVLTLGNQLCTVLDYLHTREPVIIFRDLKPANIMRTPSNKLYLIDFGIARSFKPGKLKDTIPFGSPGYAAPEQYGKTQTTLRADIYSLGALLHMLLSGDDPVDNPFHFSPLRIYGVPGLTNLVALILSRVQLDVNNRPTTIAEVKDELQRIADLQDNPRLWRPPIGQTPPSLPVVSSGSGQQQISVFNSGQQQLYMPPAQRTNLARRKFIVGSAIAGLTILGGGGMINIVSALRWSGTGGEPGGAPSRPVFGDMYFYTGHHTAPVQWVAWSLESRFIASAGDDRSLQVWTVQNAREPEKFIYNRYNVLVSVQHLAWGQTPACASMLAFSQANNLYLWDTAKGVSITPIEAASEAVIGDVSVAIKDAFAWSPNGNYIAFPTRVGLQIWGVVEKAIVKHLPFGREKIPTSPITLLAWSSDGRIAASTTNNVTIWDAQHELVNATLDDVGSKCLTWSPNGTLLASVKDNTVYISFASGDYYSHAYYTFLANITAIAWSPNGKYMIAASQNTKMNIHIWSPFATITDTTPSTWANSTVDEAGALTTRVDTNGADIHSLAWSPDGTHIAIGADQAYILEVNFLSATETVRG